MNAAVERIRTEISNLSEADRAELAQFLIASLDEGADRDAEAAWDAELERRAEEIRSGRASGEQAGKVFSDLRAKHS
jgi:putative addiction module component (TIGR02574 family)